MKRNTPIFFHVHMLKELKISDLQPRTHYNSHFLFESDIE